MASKAAFTDPSPGAGGISSIILSQRLSRVLPPIFGSRFPKISAKSLCNFLVSFLQAFLCSDGCRDLTAGTVLLSVLFFVLWHYLFPCPLAVGRRVFCPLAVLHLLAPEATDHRGRDRAGVTCPSLSSPHQALPLSYAILQATATVHNLTSIAHSRLLGIMPAPACTESSREHPGGWLLAVRPSTQGMADT